MDDEFTSGVLEGRYILLERAWAIPSRWHGALVAFRSRGDKFGVVSRLANVWRCYLGYIEEHGTYDQAWWEESEHIIVRDFEEAIAQLEAFFERNKEDTNL